ncbi:MAG: hypothetical protein RLZZ569_1299, partial [Bacteroidota bacterium]
TYEAEEDLYKAAFFYTNDTFQETLDNALNNYNEKKAVIQSVEKWSVDYQQTRYLNWLDLNK